jgi:hypothetical protein
MATTVPLVRKVVHRLNDLRGDLRCCIEATEYPGRYPHRAKHALRIEHEVAFSVATARHGIRSALPEDRHRQVQRLLHGS